MKTKSKFVGQINDKETNYFLRYEKTNENLFLFIGIVLFSLSVLTYLGGNYEKGFTRYVDCVYHH